VVGFIYPEAMELSLLDDEKKKEHPSYGMIGVTRRTHGGMGGGAVLVGSPIRHPTTICLRIMRATRYRSLSEDRFFSDERPLVEVEMSESQFARMITSANMGQGEVCTLKYVTDGKVVSVEDPPEEGLSVDYHEEIEQDVKEAVTRIADLEKRVKEMFATKKNIGVKDREEILHDIQQAKQHVEKNMPYVLHQFEEHIEKQVDSAKDEIDAFLKQRTHQLGLQALSAGEAANFMPTLPDYGCEHGYKLALSCPTCNPAKGQ
jgi:hypothetical protein